MPVVTREVLPSSMEPPVALGPVPLSVEYVPDCRGWSAVDCVPGKVYPATTVSDPPLATVIANEPLPLL